MNNIRTMLIIAFSSILVGGLYISCSRRDTDYKKYLNNKEVTYSGTISNFKAHPGNLRVELDWNPSPDPSITKYVIYWNNGADSVTVPATSSNPSDTIRTLISTHLQESNVQNFIIYTYDAKGNHSIGQQTPVVRLYGPIYQSSLYNKQLNQSNIPNIIGTDSVQIYFTKSDTSNVYSRLWFYHGPANQLDSVTFTGDTATIPLYTPGTKVWIRSYFLPLTGAIDTFGVNKVDTLPVVIQMPVPKNLFAAINAPNDLVQYDGATGVSNLWSGLVGPQGYPNIFHSNGATAMPGTITFDMGQLYNNLSIIEETGRSCCHNPGEFEVWGIADDTGAYPNLLPNDPQWSTQMTAKGWTMLGDFTRTDDGMNPMKFNFIPNPPPVRYIRVRFKSTVDNSNYVNLSQLSFWYRL